MAWFGALAQLHFDHLDLRVLCVFLKALRVEIARIIAAAEVAGANFPNEIATVFFVVYRYGPFACVVCKAPNRRTLVQCLNGVRTQRAKAHGRDIEETQCIGLFARGAADVDPKV